MSGKSESAASRIFSIEVCGLLLIRKGMVICFLGGMAGEYPLRQSRRVLPPYPRRLPIDWRITGFEPVFSNSQSDTLTH